MRNENLRAVCNELGFERVSTVISSGNVVFDAQTTDASRLEDSLERGWIDGPGFSSSTIVRNRDELQNLVRRQPFGEMEHGASSYLLATFSKNLVDVPWKLPHQPTDQPFQLVAAHDRELFTVTDSTGPGMPNVMPWLEREFGKSITSRTWLTVERILRRMDSANP